MVLVHWYACVSCGYRTRFFTREFDVLPRFAGKPAEASLARLVFLPANSMVCPISRVNLQKPHLPDLLSYPRILVCSITYEQVTPGHCLSFGMSSGLSYSLPSTIYTILFACWATFRSCVIMTIECPMSLSCSKSFSTSLPLS